MARTAETCCCFCSLPQAVHSLSLFALFQGIFSMFALIGDTGVKEDDRLQAIVSTNYLLHTFGVFFGVRGFIGLAHRDPRALRIFMFYYPYAWIVNCIITVLRAPYMCKDENVHFTEDIKKDCEMLMTASWIVLGLEFILFSYFTWIIYSLAEKFELTSGTHGLLSQDYGGGTVPYAAAEMQYFPANSYENGNQRTGPPMSPTRSPIPNQRPIPDNFTPFSGQGYHLS